MYIRGKRSLVPTSKTVFQATEIFKSSVHSVSFFLFFSPSLSLFTFFISFFLPLFFSPILFVLLRKLFAVSCDLFSITIWIFHHFSLKCTIQEQYLRTRSSMLSLRTTAYLFSHFSIFAIMVMRNLFFEISPYHWIITILSLI